MLGLLGQQGLRMQQGEVVGIALDLRSSRRGGARPWSRTRRPASWSANGAPRRDADQRDPVATAQQRRRLQRHAVEQDSGSALS